MNCLLTGSSGFLGKSISREILLENQLFCLSRSVGEYRVSLDKDIPIFDRGFDVVIHAAGKAHFIPKTEAEKQEFYRINVLGTQNLLKGLEQFSLPKQFVFISSVSVYGLESGNGVNEECLLDAKDSYGLSKIKSEKIVEKWCEENNVVCTILRLPLLVGFNPPGNLGSMINGIRKGYYFNIAGGTAKKSMVLVDDVAHVILKVAKVGGTYNLTDGYHPTFNELSQNIALQLGGRVVFNIPYLIAFFVAKFGDIVSNHFPLNSQKLSKICSTLTFDDSKARREFGWNPTPVLKGFTIYE